MSGFNVQNRYLIVLYYNAKRHNTKLSTKEQEEQLRDLQVCGRGVLRQRATRCSSFIDSLLPCNHPHRLSMEWMARSTRAVPRGDALVSLCAAID